ncbi:MAG: tetratricopeptide repeat protein, partial [Phycisphaeraceae bacterium]
ADHWQYWASMGLISLAAAVGYLTADRLGRRAKGIATIVLALVLTTFGTLTWRQSGLYLSQETLWRDTFRKNPGSWMVNTNLGHAMLVEGKVDEAVRHYREALQVKPLYAGTQHNMGISLALQGELDQAIRHFRQALRIKPDFADAHHNLGNALAMQGRLEDAIRHFHRALRLRPDYAKAHYNLGNALQSQGRIDEAIRHYHQALTIAPDFAAARRMLANLQQIKAQQRNQTPTVP